MIAAEVEVDGITSVLIEDVWDAGSDSVTPRCLFELLPDDEWGDLYGDHDGCWCSDDPLALQRGHFDPARPPELLI